jgi:predicted nucleotidyltransferase
MNTTERLIKLLRDFFKGESDIILSFLFGSYVSGRNIKSSDIDIGVWFREKPSIDRILKLTGEIEDILKREVDLLPLNYLSPTVAFQALRGKPILIKDEKFYLEYLLKVSQEAEDMQDFTFDFFNLKEKIKDESINQESKRKH